MIEYDFTFEETIKRAAVLIKNADALFVTTGAGMGVDSGLPDFRGNEGFWKAYPPIAKLGISFAQMANPRWFDTNPNLAWAFYGHRLNLYRRTLPHQGFYQLLEIGGQKKGGYYVFTSNVDGQFQKAGYDQNRIVECHGSIHHFQCISPCCDEIWAADEIEVHINDEIFEAFEPLPTCFKCGKLARPNILMFGDWSWISSRTDAQENKLYAWLQNITLQNWKLAIIEVGAGDAVPTVRHTSERIAHEYNGTLIRINPRDRHVPFGHLSLQSGAKEGINKIYQLIP